MTTQLHDHSTFSDALEKRGVTWPLGSYAPGNYIGRCVACREEMSGVDKRAMHCLPCEIADRGSPSSDGRRDGREAVVMRCFHLETAPDEVQGIECIRCVDCGEGYLGRNAETFRLELRLTDELIAEIDKCRRAGDAAMRIQERRAA